MMTYFLAFYPVLSTSTLNILRTLQRRKVVAVQTGENPFPPVGPFSWIKCTLPVANASQLQLYHWACAPGSATLGHRTQGEFYSMTHRSDACPANICGTKEKSQHWKSGLFLERTGLRVPTEWARAKASVVPICHVQGRSEWREMSQFKALSGRMMLSSKLWVAYYIIRWLSHIRNGHNQFHNYFILFSH